MSDWKGRLTQYQSFMESYLAGRFLNEGEPQQKLFEAMRYSLLAGGKRLRPVLVLEFCRLCGGTWEHALDFAAAIEMVPQNYQKLESEDDIKNMEKLIDMLEDDDDVQNVWHNWDQD